MKTLKRISICALALCLVGIISAFIYYKLATKDVTLIPERLTLHESNLTLYDSDNNLIPLGTEANRQTVSKEEIPWHTKQAFIDVEDRRFYKHGGFDVKGIARAMLHNLKSHSLKEGASTISQQLIKNSHLTQEKTFTRKLREWKLTRQLEKMYSKDEILTMYLNTIYFGHNCFGIASASEFYFNKKPAELTIAESAMLAGIIKSPNNYSPFRKSESCLKRRACVLGIMEQNGSISHKQKLTALNEALPTPHKQENKSKKYAYFTLDELASLADECGFHIGGKIEIQTFMDKNLQAYMEELSTLESDYGKAFLALDVKTGGFKACISDIGNVCRLPGSILKPLLVYAPALQEDYLSPATPILDEAIDYNGYSPQNYDGKYHGYVSARECVEQSLNIPAVKILSSLGVSKGVKYLEKMGVPVQKEDESLALALGGMKHGYKLTQLLAAYSVFPNGGLMQSSGFIKEIKINGATVYKKTNVAKRVFSDETAYLMTDMLKSTVSRGTAKKLRDLPIDIAAKTGTVGTKNGNTDAYALSYTTKDCLAVWCGNADNTKIDCTGGGAPCNYLKKLNEYLSTEYENNGEQLSPFVQPKGIVKIELDKPSYYATHTMQIADDNAPADFRFCELFKKGAIPLDKSTSFTFPSIVSPSIFLENNHVVIRFNPHSPTYYRYKIERRDYATHTTIYEGEFIEEFIDYGVESNKTYTYVITPTYKDALGKKVTLPSISTSTKNSTIVEDNKIRETEWWNK